MSPSPNTCDRAVFAGHTVVNTSLAKPQGPLLYLPWCVARFLPSAASKQHHPSLVPFCSDPFLLPVLAKFSPRFLVSVSDRRGLLAVGVLRTQKFSPPPPLLAAENPAVEIVLNAKLKEESGLPITEQLRPIRTSRLI